MADRTRSARFRAHTPESSLHPADAARSRARPLALAFPVLLALVLSVHRAVTTPMWRDEYATASYSALGYPDLFRALGAVDAVLGPYYALMHVFAALPGDQTAWLRVPSILAFVTGTLLVGLLALRWWGSWAALAAGTAFALNGVALAQAANARPYALAAAFFLGAVLMLDVATDRDAPARRAWVAFSVLAAASVAMHLFALLALSVTPVLARRAWRTWMIAVLPALVLGAVAIAAGSGQRAQVEWISVPGAREAVAILAHVAGVATGRAIEIDAVLLALVVLVAVLAAVSVYGRTNERGERRAQRVTALRPLIFAAALFVVPWVCLLAASWVAEPILIDRYLVWSVPGAALLVGAAVHEALSVRTRAGTAAGIAAVLTLAVVGGVAVERAVRPVEADGALEQAVGRLESAARPGDLIIIVQRYWEGGVASEFAAAAGDRAYMTTVHERLPARSQPLLDVRRAVSADPLRTVEHSGAVEPGGAVWVVTIDPLDGSDLVGIDRTVAVCLERRSAPDVERFGDFRLERMECAG